VPDIDEILSGARDAIAAKRVYAEPVERDGATVIPAAAVRGAGEAAATRRTTAAPGSASVLAQWGRT
jgi:hypothetical protein